ncbi:hypothetical protein A6R68_20858, partial [Neotoma lepida]
SSDEQRSLPRGRTADWNSCIPIYSLAPVRDWLSLEQLIPQMKLNISFPATGCQKLIEVDNECKCPAFSEKCTASELAADALGAFLLQTKENQRERKCKSVQECTVDANLSVSKAEPCTDGPACALSDIAGDEASTACG